MLSAAGGRNTVCLLTGQGQQNYSKEEKMGHLFRTLTMNGACENREPLRGRRRASSLRATPGRAVTPHPARAGHAVSGTPRLPSFDNELTLAYCYLFAL